MEDLVRRDAKLKEDTSNHISQRLNENENEIMVAEKRTQILVAAAISTL